MTYHFMRYEGYSGPMSIDSPQRFRGGGEISGAFPVRKRLALSVFAVFLGVVIAGFWNFHFVDGLGETAIAAPLIGDTGEAAGSFATQGVTFGLLFAIAAGLAATFTACNCVVFAMLPELACRVDDSGARIDRSVVYRSLGSFVGGVLIIGAPYGAFVGFAGPGGIEAMNEVRLAQAQAIFSFIGIGLLIWGLVEMGFLTRVRKHLDPITLAFLAQPVTRAGVLGLFVGLFAVGRPFPVFRDFLAYAAAAESPLFGVGVMMIHGIAMIAVMIVLLLTMVYFLGGWLTRWVQTNPHGPQALSGFALLTGGAFFFFYWGLARVFDIGRWGYRLGIYG